MSGDIDLDVFLKRLHLANARRLWRDLIQRAEKEQWSHGRLLQTLFDEEVAHRRGTRLQRAVRAAEFPFLRTVEEFDFTYQSTLRLTTIGSLLAPDFVTEGRSAIFVGKPGRGKTHLAIAIAYRVIQNGFDALFTTAAALIEDLSAASRDGGMRDRLALYVRPHVLVVDEVGYLAYGADAANVLYHLVNDRHIKRRAMIFTTNKNPKRWGEALHDDDLAEAIVDRILERGRLLRLDGPSIRTNHLPSDELAGDQLDDSTGSRVSGMRAAEFPEPTDVIVEGHVTLRDGWSGLAEIEVGACARRVRAWAPRTIRGVGAGRVEWFASERAERVALVATEAYGGCWDAPTGVAPPFVVGPPEPVGYPRNLAGRGFVTRDRAATLVGTAMPSLEDPERPVEPDVMIREDLADWVDAPFPPLFGWLDLGTFPRSRFFGERVPHRAWQRMPRECELGVLSPEEFAGARLRDQVDLDAGPLRLTVEPRAFTNGAVGLSRHRLRGGEPVVLRGLFRDAPEAAFLVPGPRSVVGLTPPGCPRFDLPTELVAMLMDAEARTVTLVEQASLEVAAPYPDAEFALVTAERVGETHP